jgi:hypothetical protein
MYWQALKLKATTPESQVTRLVQKKKNRETEASERRKV